MNIVLDLARWARMAHQDLSSGVQTVMRKVLATIVTAAVLLVAGASAAAAEEVGHCWAGGESAAAGSTSGGTGLTSAASLASTGSGIDVTTWAAVGIGLVLVGMILMLVLPGSRRRSRTEPTTTA